MMRKLIACSLAALLAFLPLESFAVLKGVAAAPGLQNAAAVAITGGTITGVIGVTDVLGASGVSVGIAPTGTMGNNGAVTLGTALDRTYTEGLWLFYPAGAVAAGVPAAASFLWTVMSSATVGTVFNSVMPASGAPAVGTQTAYVTTGPGAFTGDTAEHGILIPVAAGLMGAMGVIDANASFRQNNTAGNKTGHIRFSSLTGTNLVQAVNTTVTGATLRSVIANMTPTAQSVTNQSVNLTPTWVITSTNTTIDTTVATTVSVSIQVAVATDWQIISAVDVTLKRSS